MWFHEENFTTKWFKRTNRHHLFKPNWGIEVKCGTSVKSAHRDNSKKDMHIQRQSSKARILFSACTNTNYVPIGIIYVHIWAPTYKKFEKALETIWQRFAGKAPGMLKTRCKLRFDKLTVLFFRT